MVAMAAITNVFFFTKILQETGEIMLNYYIRRPCCGRGQLNFSPVLEFVPWAGYSNYQISFPWVNKSFLLTSEVYSHLQAMAMQYKYAWSLIQRGEYSSILFIFSVLILTPFFRTVYRQSMTRHGCHALALAHAWGPPHTRPKPLRKARKAITRGKMEKSNSSIPFPK